MNRRPVTVIFAAPALLAILSLSGLVAGLIGDGGWDVAAWVGLGMPVLVGLRSIARRGGARP